MSSLTSFRDLLITHPYHNFFSSLAGVSPSMGGGVVVVGGINFLPSLFYLIAFPHLDVVSIGAPTNSIHPRGGKRKYSNPLADSPPR